MKSAIFMNGKKFDESNFGSEETFEKIVKQNFKTLFGAKTVYFDIKSKIDSRALGSAIPDAFLFDFRDEENPDFYLVEVELEEHDFYRHIFPQITKFFAFFNNSASRNQLVERLFIYVKSNQLLEQEFKKYLGNREIYKALKDIIENSQNILLVIDDIKPEMQEVFETYTDTWKKMVKIEVLKEYTAEGKTIFTMNPDFDEINLPEPPDGGNSGGSEESSTKPEWTEIKHLEGVNDNIVSVYKKIKAAMIETDPKIIVNPTASYISLKSNRNFAYIRFSKAKMHIVIMLPFEKGKELINNHKVKILSEREQRFWNGPCFQVTLNDESTIEEIVNTLDQAYNQHV